MNAQRRKRIGPLLLVTIALAFLVGFAMIGCSEDADAPSKAVFQETSEPQESEPERIVYWDPRIPSLIDDTDPDNPIRVVAGRKPSDLQNLPDLETEFPDGLPTRQSEEESRSDKATMPLDVTDAVPLSFAEFPDDIALLTREHPYTHIGRDGLRSSELLRIFKRPGEGVVREVLFSNTIAEQLGIEGGVLKYAVAPDVSTIVANICLEGVCASPYVPVDGRTALYQSKDGGVTWQPLASFDVAWVIEQLLPSDGDETKLLLRNERSRNATPHNLDYMLWPSGESVTPPEPPDGHRVLGTVLLSDGRVAWGMDALNLSFPIFLTGDGEDVTDLAVKQLTPDCPSCSMTERRASLGRFYYYAGGHVALEISDGLYILGWGSAGPSARPKYSLEQLQGGATTSTEETGDDIYWPTIRDSNTMEEWPIRLPEDVLKLGDMFLPAAIQRGPFLVVTDVDDCLPLRAEPSPEAEELDCVAEGVLLQDQGEAIEVDGTTWRKARTPAGVVGWADSVVRIHS